MLVFEERGKPEYPEKNVTFSEKIEGIKNILKSWSARRLTLLGKITIIKAFAVSQIVTCSVLSPN